MKDGERRRLRALQCENSQLERRAAEQGLDNGKLKDLAEGFSWARPADVARPVHRVQDTAFRIVASVTWTAVHLYESGPAPAHGAPARPHPKPNAHIPRPHPGRNRSLSPTAAASPTPCGSTPHARQHTAYNTAPFGLPQDGARPARSAVKTP